MRSAHRIPALAAIFLATTGCAPRATVVAGLDSCPARDSRWETTGSGKRVLRVALRPDEGTVDAWEFHGAERLRRAIEAWNLLDLPLRLTTTDDVGAADIRVFVVRRIPADSAGSPEYASYQAGLTRLTLDRRGAIVRAHVAVAEATPAGVSYSVDDQVATLMHELGHAIGLHHAASPMALMSARPVVSSPTRTDVQMARAIYRGICPTAVVARTTAR